MTRAREKKVPDGENLHKGNNYPASIQTTETTEKDNMADTEDQLGYDCFR
jgi:hypothetical protein